LVPRYIPGVYRVLVIHGWKGDTRSSVLRTAAARWLIIVRAYRWL
jgi:hypothetical protein